MDHFDVERVVLKVIQNSIQFQLLFIKVLVICLDQGVRTYARILIFCFETQKQLGLKCLNEG